MEVYIMKKILLVLVIIFTVTALGCSVTSKTKCGIFCNELSTGVKASLYIE